MNAFNILIAGVGGQGVLLTSKIIAEAALLQGLDVKQSEVHGMAQRGGSVLSQVRFGDQVFSPIVAEGEADLLIGFEPLETARYLHFLREDGIVVYNTRPIGTIGVSIGKEAYPQDIHDTIKKHASKVHPFDATNVAVEVGEKRAVNLVLMGAVLRFLPLKESVVDEAITNSVPKKVLDINRKAFLAGKAKNI
ncbi:MAG: indolepyruvate oxidoreductase subunit beta [Nitrospirae bacterium]|nr:indolepyruvate oxidoreductase subunit beta [Nitrospirota bacterium]NTW66504.1 indolepyruvate oxidoreductase subunit beta [Nitrospirota bacterium]